MAVITKQQILERVKSGNIAFTPELDIFQIQRHAIDMRLGFTFLVPKQWHLTNHGREALSIDHFQKDNPDYFDVVELEQSQTFDLLPGEYVLVSTFESVKVPNDLMAVLYPRSSTNRRGLSVDLTGIIDSGYEGQLVIPVRNNTHSQVIKLYPGERFCQIVFDQLDQPAEDEKSRYHQKDIIEGFIRKNPTGGKKDDAEQKYIKEGLIRELKTEFRLNKESHD